MEVCQNHIDLSIRIYMKLSDEDIEKALASAKIPSYYRHKDRSLYDEGGELGSELAIRTSKREFTEEFLAEFLGKNIEIHGKVYKFKESNVRKEYDTREVEACFFLFIRNLILWSVPSYVVYAEDLIPSLEQVKECKLAKVLGIYGMTPQGSDPFGTTRSRLEWVIQGLILNGKGIVFLNDDPIMVDNLWSHRFRVFIESTTMELED